MDPIGEKNVGENEQFPSEIKVNEDQRRIVLLAIENLPKPDFNSLRRTSDRLACKRNIAKAPKKPSNRERYVDDFRPQGFKARTLYFPTFTAKNAAG